MQHQPSRWLSTEGTAFPLGATWIPESRAHNFALYSKHATQVTLLLFRSTNVHEPAVRIELHHLTNKSGRVWHCLLPESVMAEMTYYAYLVDGPRTSNEFEQHAFDPEKLLLDPYASEVYFPDTFTREAARLPGSNMGRAPLGIISREQKEFDWEGRRPPLHEHDLIIYEMHVRGFTRHNSSGVDPDRRGTYLGVIDKIPYLKELGITAVELLPVQQFDPDEGNYWGYMPLNFFAPHAQYATDIRQARNEFQTLVKEFHAARIEVLLDVVFNHTTEGDEDGPCYSFKGIDNSTYYMSGDASQPYANYSGTGNTLHSKNRYVSRMILTSLRNWVREYHIDGFRFDLAAVFNRHADGSVSAEDSRMIGAIRADPDVGRVRLIAEPWDAAGLNQLGKTFPGRRWRQWNGRFRDEIRRFVKGDPGMVSAAMLRMYGSDDLFPDSLMESRHPYQSVNYVNSHDGFTLYDLVSYNERHNQANGHHNQDGNEENYSWNCGFEGDEQVPDKVLQLRKRQARNFCCLLMLANGTPMFCAGDEFLNTQLGNNNPYNQDNEVTWLDWSRLSEHRDFFRFFRLMIAFRKSHPTIARSRFWRDDIRWHGRGPTVEMSPESRHFAYYLDGRSQEDADLYVMINAEFVDLTFEIQEQHEAGWRLVADTSHESPEDIFQPGMEPLLKSPIYHVKSRSVVLLMRTRSQEQLDTSI